MRYDTPVFFQRITPGAFDEETHNYGADIVIEKRRYASVTDTGTQMLTMVYDKIPECSKTIRLQRPYDETFDRIRIGAKVYRVDFERARKNFVISEVP